MFVDFDALKKGLNNLSIKKVPKTFLQILDKTYNEVLVSKYLAYFIDERNTNRSIVQQILQKTKVSSEPDFEELLANSTFESIKTEDQISSQSRLDIIVKYSQFWLVIENKIWAWESKANQTSDYEKQLSVLNKDKLPVKYIYLKPEFNKSRPSNKHFIQLYYKDLVDILNSVNQEQLADQENYLYLRDFTKHVEEYFMKENEEFDDPALQFYFENRNKIDHVVSTYNTYSKKIMILLNERLQDSFSDYKVHGVKSYTQIFKKNWENKGSTGLHFEIQASEPLDKLLGNKAVTFKYSIHNEANTRERYPSVPHKLELGSGRYLFNNSENIFSSIQSIVEDMKTIVENNVHIIDDAIAKGPVK